MAQPQMMQIKLSRFDAQPWGFRLQGGTDFAQPLLVQKVNGGSLAEKAGLMPGDAVIKINDVDVFNLRHKDAQDIVVRSGNNFVMTVQRGGSTWRPHVQLTGNVPHPNAGNLHTVTKTSLAHKQQEVQHIGSGYNNSARPFGGSAVDGNVKSIVNKQYNTPVGIYSDESIAETLSAQAEVLAGGVLGVNFKKNEKEYQADKSEVLKFLREEESGTSTPEPPSATSYYATKSHAIGGNELRSPQTEERITAKFQKPTTTQAPPPSAPAPSKVEIPVPTEPEQPDPRLIVMPVCPALQTPEYKEEMEKAAAAAADGDQPKPYTASGHPACSMCGVGIVGVFVRIKDKNLHVECFKCATCGTNLKNQGYYNFNNKLYCDIHAKLAALQNPPPGTEGYVPVPIKPNTKLSASTISSALNTHGYNNGVSNGSSTPTPAPAADMNLNDLPLPPPPSPTQLQQYEQDQGNVTNISNIPPPPPHTRTLSSLSSMSSGSNTTHSSTHSLSPTPYQYQHQGQGPCNNVIMQTHNITMDPYASTSPMHSRQTSSSSSSLNYASDNNYMTSPPPPPPPPLPLPSMLPPAAEDNRNGDLYIDTMKQQQNAIGSNNSSKLLTNRNNENDKNSYNKSGNGNGIGVGNGTTFQPNTHKVAPTAVTGPTSTITTTKSPSSSNIPIVDKSLINSNNTYNPESNTTTTTTTFNTGTNDMSSTMASSGPSVQPTSETSSNGVGGDKPFEYVTLTGNVIRSVVPPGKGTNVNYKVNNQGYARPYGAPPAAAPKSPVTFPPQTQQWNAPPPTQPKPSAPAGNPYATLPRSNVGQGQDRAGPVTMAFQPLDEHMVRDHSQTPSRPYTPSRPAPIVPRYQTPEKLCFDECPAAHARDYDFRSASPFPDRARSPACGPPPNPLAAIRAPRIKDPDVSSMSPRVLQAGSITTGQSYLGAQQAQKQEQILAHTESSSHSGMQSFSQQPEKKEEYQIGNMSVQKREQSSRMAEQQQRQMQSQTTTQVGNTQIERRRKVTEEYEHTSSAKTVEIRTGSQSSSTDRRQSTASYGKGYVANQARRLSGLEQEITNLTPQSQAISARAAHLTENKFPEFHSPEPLEKFPTKPLLPSYDEPKPPSYIVSGASTKSVANTSSSCYQQKQEQKQLSTAYGSSVFSSQQQQQQQQKSLTTYSSVSSSQQQQQQQVNTVSSSVTKASAATNNQAYKSITAGTNNQTATSSSSASTGICPVTGTFCRPGHTCCKQQSMHSNNNTNNNNNNNNVSNGAAYRPNASLGSASNASNFAANSQPPRQQQQQQSQATAPATKAPAASSASAPTTMSNQNNNGGSAGSTGSAGGMAPKGGSYGATSAPKRGRGVMNKPAGPGVRIPLCNSCGTQVRGPFITALGKIWCPEHFHCTNGNCRRPLQDIGFVEEKGDLYCEYCFEKYLAPGCSKCGGKIKGDCLNAIGKHFHPECFSCGHCGKLFGNTPFFLEDGMPYCEADWNELFTTKCFACGFPVEAGDRWVEALNHNYHSQCFNCTYCKQNLEGQSFYNKGGRPFCKNHAR
ncbi:Z band alternatively spliced PDZ-motif protein 52 isoform X10 [Haematobia irritans]|uniref:Z band alternatively spliced PDZ-motif protein 52 isoform X10 n=1 Tax=Haematobia irritans TaxID=7368 RepID=UPI003F5051F3